MPEWGVGANDIRGPVGETIREADPAGRVRGSVHSRPGEPADARDGSFEPSGPPPGKRVFDMTAVSASVLLFLVMDPLGNIPFFLSALRHTHPSRHRRVILRELLIALGVLTVFLFAGRYILLLLSISEPALSTAGGVVLLLIAVRMIFPSPDKPLQEEVHEEPFVVPLAIPYVAGPSALATELLLMSREPERWAEWLGALLAAWTVCAVIILFSARLGRLLGHKGLVAMERLMGMVLITVAVQMLLNGMAQALRAER